jgi:hypothetical protein
MNVQKILCLASLVCLTTILPTLLPTQAETLSQDSVEISKEKWVYRLNHADLALTYPEAFAEQRFQPKMCSC